ncbi:MAG TPA: class I SAM-dependent methyltransferase [Mycobacteriales bacterium]|nr:class I SAM-dependent methyltransferase [Mycobacteriales bacterium]
MSYDNPQSLFAGTHEHYLRYRVPHPSLFTDLVASLAPPGPILDLGCGPGSVALALAERGRQVLAIDANADMIAAGRAEAARRGCSSAIDWICTDVHVLDDVPQVAAATMADALHWFDRTELLTTLDRIVAPGGFLSVIMSFSAGTTKPWWHPLTERIVDRHLGRARHAGPQATFTASAGGSHETVLRASAFNDLTVMRTDQRVRMDLDHVLGNQHTQAFSSPPVLGAQREGFDRDLAVLLLAAEPTGWFEDTTQPGMIIARRAPEAS